MGFGKIRQFRKVLAAHDGAGRIVRVADQEDAGAGRDVRFQVFRRDAEFVFDARGNGDGDASRQRGAGLVGNVARLRDQHFVAGRKQRAQREVERLADADGDEDVGFRVVVEAVLFFLVPRDFLQKLGQAAVPGVGGASLFEAVDAAFADGPWRHEVRFADAEGDHILHFGGGVEKFPDARGRNGLHLRRDALFPVEAHGDTTSLWSRSFGPVIRPSFL